jgi:predicted N-acetyltransferase YhbS
MLRPLAAADLRSLAHLWNSELGTEFPVTERVLRLVILEDPTFRDGDALLASQSDTVVGAAWLKRWREPYEQPRFLETGFIGGLVVQADRRQQGIASQLLAALEQCLRLEGCTHVEVSGGLLHLLPGIPSSAADALGFFGRHGYAIDDEPHYDLLGDPGVLGTPVPGVRLARSVDEVLGFLAREFPGSWQLHARWHFLSGGQASDFVVMEHDGTVEGFCQIIRPNAWPPGPSTYRAPAWCGLGPIGVSERLRGRGLGHKLMQGSLHELAQSGVHTCVIDWTRLLRFYGQFGFAPWRRYYRAAKALT